VFAAYNFVSWLPTCLCGGTPLIFIFGFFDLSFVSLLLSAIVLQSPYMPKTSGACHHSTTLSSGLFQRLAQAELKTYKPSYDDHGNLIPAPSPNSVCGDFLFVWQLEIAVL
jgi:hypothetical protein